MDYGTKSMMNLFTNLNKGLYITLEEQDLVVQMDMRWEAIINKRSWCKYHDLGDNREMGDTFLSYDGLCLEKEVQVTTTRICGIEDI